MTVKTVEDVPCKLSAEEQLLKSKELTQKMRERAQVDVQKKGSVAMYKDMAERLDDEIRVLVEAVANGEELRPVECIEQPRYGELLVNIVRTDTGDVYRVRAMHPTERQTAMEIGDLAPVVKVRGNRDDESTH